MVKNFSHLIALAVLAVVLTGVFHAGCRQAILADTLSGMMVGLAHGTLSVYCLRERLHGRTRLTVYRVKKVFVHALLMDTSVGLLIGIVSAIGSLCGR